MHRKWTVFVALHQSTREKKQKMTYLFGNLAKKQYLCTRKKRKRLFCHDFLMVNIAEWSSW